MSLEPARRHYLAVGIVSMALLTLEITVARVLSVALSSHYAFVAISLAMFGLGLSGLIVYLLGMAYPLGIAVLREFDARLVPWAWGLNGALSVVASVLAIFLGSRFGFTTAFWTGVGAYGIALVVMAVAPRLRASRAVEAQMAPEVRASA
jgi:hypothetical protein